MKVPFLTQDEIHYGIIEQISPKIRKILSENPSPFTYHGTGTFIVGRGEVAVIDPGPVNQEHIDAILSALEGEVITHIVITHTHRDHSPGAALLVEKTGAQVVGGVPILADNFGDTEEIVAIVGKVFDLDYAPDRILQDGDRISGKDWTLEAVFTPGHCSNHLCYYLKEENALFSGDHVMGWSTTVIAAPDGNMAHYMDSLRKLLDLNVDILYPTHGPKIEKPERFIRALMMHRRMREEQILKALNKSGPLTIAGLVDKLYVKTPKGLKKAAYRTVMAHLIDMQARRLVNVNGDLYHAISTD